MGTPHDSGSRTAMPGLGDNPCPSGEPLTFRQVREAAGARITIIRALLAIGIILPLVFLIALVTHYWVDVPYMDEWDVSTAISRHHERTLRFKALLEQHNEHRLLVVRVVTVGLSLVNRGDLRWQMAFSVLLATATFVGIARLLSRSGAQSARRRWVVLLLISLIVFSPVQWANWLMGMQFGVFLPPLLLVLGVLVSLSGRSLWIKSMVNSLLAFLATYSFAHGMILWLLAAPREFMPWGRSGRGDGRWRLCLLWYVVAAAGTIALYFHGYQKPRGKPALDYFLNQPGQTAAYYLSWLGNSLVPEGSALGSDVRTLVGGILLGVFVAWLICGRRPRTSSGSVADSGGAARYPWVTLGLYSALSGAVVTAGRAGFGVNQAAESRYTTFSLFLTVAVVVGGCQLLARWRTTGLLARFFRGGATLVAIAGLVSLHIGATITSIRWMEVRHTCMTRAKTALVMHRIVPEAALLRTLYPNTEKLLREFARLKFHGVLNYDAIPEEEFLDACHIAGPPDAANGCVDWWYFPDANHMTYRGWVRLGDTGRPGSHVILTWRKEDGPLHPFGMAVTTRERLDVVNALHDDRLAQCGFEGTTSLRCLPQGPVEIAAWTMDLNDRSVHRLASHPWTILRRPPRS